MTGSGNTATWLTFFIGVLLAVVAFQVVDDLERGERRAAFEQSALERVQAVERWTVESLEIVRSTGDFISASDALTSEKFQSFVAPALRRQKNIQALEWIPRVPAAFRRQHESDARAEGASTYRITERDDQGEPRPAGERAVYYPVRYAEPMAGNERAIGFDLGSNAERLAALERARDNAELVASEPIRLVQETEEDQFAFLAVYPVFKHGIIPATIEDRSRQLDGFALGVFRIGAIISAIAVGSEPTYGVDIYLFDVPSQTLLHKQRFGAGEQEAPSLESGALAGSLSVSRIFNLGGRDWQIIARPSRALVPPWQPWAAAGSLLVITALLMAHLQASRRRAARVQALVEQRTTALNVMVRTLTRLHAISSNVNRPYGERVADAMDLGRELFGLPLAMVSRVKEGAYTVMHVRGPEGAPEVGNVFPVEHTYCERTLAADGPVGFHAASGTEWESHPCYTQFQLEAYLGAPLTVDGEIYGTLNFTSPEKRAAPFSEEERAFVSLLAQWIGKEIERARSLDALDESFELYKGLLRDSLQGVLIARDGVPLYVNPAFARIFGYEDEQEIMNLPSLDALYAPEELERIKGYRGERLRGGQDLPSRYEFRGLRKDGDEIWCEYITQPTEWMGERAVRTFAQDITSRKQAALEVERLLETRTAELRLRERAIDAASNGILITDAVKPDNPIIYVNPAFERITGYRSEEIVGLNCRFLQNDDRDQPDIGKIRQAIEDGRSVQGVLKNYRKDGTLFWNALEIAPVRDAEGRVTHFIGIQTDITEEKQREDQIRALQRLETVGRLTGGVAHDFNNLLTVIVGNLRLASTMISGNDRVLERIDGATRAAFRGASLIRQLLAFARRQVLEPEVLDPAKAVSHTCKLLERTVGGTVVVRSQISSDVTSIRVDPAQLETALVNLALNARDAMPEGGEIVISMENAEIDQSFAYRHAGARPGEYVRITVEDSGTGMSEQVERQAMEPFFTTKEVGEGSGLGLSMVYGFVKQSDGYLQIETRPNVGTRVHLYLPRWREPAPAALTRSKNETLPTGTESILVVEDELEVREITVSMLEMLGYRVIAARDGHSALAKLIDGASADLLITDVVMPGGMTGPELALEARRLRPELRVIYISGHSAEAIPLELSDDEGIDLLKKPYADDELARRVRASLDGKYRAEHGAETGNRLS